MQGLSKVIVLDPDARASRQVQLGFEREGVPVAVAAVPVDAGRIDLPAGETGLVVVGGADGQALELVRRARRVLDDQRIDAPIVFAGRGVRRLDAEAAGADAVVLQPAFLRDVVTIGRLLRGQPATQRAHIVGSLAETTGVFTLVRALAALGRSAVLTLIRGLRRGEIRFFHGEVTSAQVGLIHGQAALHQLLLWTEARFDFHHEDVVRRHQIPLSHDELFADAERFLEGVRDASGPLSPSMVLEQDTVRVQSLGKQVPTEVHGVLRMFDGHRVLADVLEDSPYRVFETLRVAQRAVDVGLLRPVDTQRPKATWRAVLAIEEWLVGDDRDAVIARSAADSGPLPAANASRDTGKTKGNRRKRKKQRANTPLPMPVVNKAEIDWGALVPRVVGAEVGPLAGVVPAAQTSGEFEMPTREAPREKLEALMDTDKRERIFPTDIGLEPKVVFEDDQEVARKQGAAAAAAAAAAAEAARVAREREQAQALVRATIARQAREREEAEARANAEDAKLRAEASEWAREQAKARMRAEDERAREAQELAERLAKARAGATSTAATANAPAPEPAGDRARDLVKQLVAEEQITTPPVTVTETPSAVVVVQDTMTVTGSDNTARLVATSNAVVTEAAPHQTLDEPSDGIVRQTTAFDSTPVPRHPPPGPVPADDRPDDATGEISAPRAASAPTAQRSSEPSILVADVGDIGDVAEVSADIVAAQHAISAVVATQAAAPPSSDIATPSREFAVAEARKDAQAAAVAFSEAEEAFFRAGHEKDKVTKTASLPAPETFDDLDEGYQPVGFWDRLRGKRIKVDDTGPAPKKKR